MSELPTYYPIDELISKQREHLQANGYTVPSFPTQQDALVWLNRKMIQHLSAPRLPHHTYFITLTATKKDPSELHLCFLWLRDKYVVKESALELTKEGMPHIHCIVEANDYINKHNIYLKNGKNYVDVRKLKKQSDVLKVTKYIHKNESKPDSDWILKWGIDPLDL